MELLIFGFFTIFMLGLVSSRDRQSATGEDASDDDDNGPLEDAAILGLDPLGLSFRSRLWDDDTIDQHLPDRAWADSSVFDDSLGAMNNPLDLRSIHSDEVLRTDWNHDPFSSSIGLDASSSVSDIHSGPCRHDMFASSGSSGSGIGHVW